MTARRGLVESVEIRIVCDRPYDCTHGVPKPIGFTDHCSHRFECDWGDLNNTEADPRRGLQHLMLITSDYAQRMLDNGPEPGVLGGTCSAAIEGERAFVHLDYEGKRTTWELFPTHFEDGLGPEDLMIGRWPD